ncbi:hypothetical protein SH601_00100 [Gracilibacillus sp. S3-1-1]|uniref:Uncharacterized protein n=1 Tax=Gracilibacillus pellucidus TaxID=3095368 RepID=A0ACC6M0B6_9BACI|nr:hypothetical protein [Gracilibacillus sp. S3-1-1]MDX8044373.1 hypothetical protein [Gracilibacillus sp. S3-1-1]
MNELLYQYARNKSLKELSIADQRLYTYVEAKEVILTKKAVTEQQLYDLFFEKSPILEAAKAFDLAPKKVYDTVQRIELYLENRMQYYANTLQFVDVTDLFELNGLVVDNQQVRHYLLPNS